VTDALREVRRAIGTVIRGKASVIDDVLVGILAGGHVLIEDVPGVGKTTLAKAIARVFDISFARVQFTPDLLPSDITGTVLLDPKSGALSFHRGPVFSNLVLADEINRASPRTQSALLEAMNEAQVTVDGTTHPLPEPFFVLATQNPSDYQGTYPLPEAQLDRFHLRLSVGYPDEDESLAMLFARQRDNPLEQLTPVCDKSALLAMQAKVRDVEVKPEVARYMLAIVTATRRSSELALGVSPRGALALFRSVQARAFLRDRAYASPEDVKALATATLAHRIQLRVESVHGGGRGDAVIERILGAVSVPT
jgi:MoxR-like ATPase